jgi:DNA-binding LacI/PurR family transcriptional regulator
MSVTIKDIARVSGFSVTTISRVLNDRAPHIPQGTRQRVRDVANQMGYRPNAIAQSLRQHSTKIIGFHSAYGPIDVMDPFITELIDGMLRAAEAAGKDFLMHGNVGGRSAEVIYRELLNGKVDGLLLLTPPNGPLVPLLSESDLPVVVVTDAVPTLPSVVADDAAGSCLLARYLAAKGHEKVIYRKSSLETTSDMRRFHAFCEAADEAGMAVVEITTATWSVGFTEGEAARMRGSREERPTAIACWNDFVAYQTIEACLEMGLKVPDDVAVVGYNGGSSWLAPPPAHNLTTVRANWGDVARVAVELLLERLSGKEIPMETIIPVDMVIGETA